MVVREKFESHQPIAMNVPVEAGIAAVPTPFWSPCEGLNYASPVSRVQVQHAREIVNFRLFEQMLRPRLCITKVGTVLLANLMAVIKYINVDGVGRLLRLSNTKIQLYNATDGTWTDLPGTYTFTGGIADKWTFTAFGESLLFSNGVDGLFEYDVSIGQVSLLAGAPAAKHLSTFNGRVIASDVRDPTRNPGRISWSVKNNSHDWTGTGSGYEDLLSTPGGEVDKPLGVYPMTDTMAIIVRSRSIWLMSETGDVDAPFKFNRQYSNIVCIAPKAITEIPGAIIVVLSQSIVMMTESNITPIGDLVAREIVRRCTSVADMRGAYNPDTLEFLLASPEAGGTTAVYRYSFEAKGWSRSVYAGVLADMVFGRGSTGSITIDQLDTLAATINALPGPNIDELGVVTTGDVNGMLFVFEGNNVFQENTAATQDALGAGTVVPLSINTGLLAAGTPQQTTEVNEVQIEYENMGAAITGVVQYSLDKGVTWLTYASTNLVPTTGPSVVSVVATVSGHNLQFKLSVTAWRDVRIVSFTPFEVLGEMTAKGST